MQTTTAPQLLATVLPDASHDSTFEAVWATIYEANKTMIDTLLLAPDIAFIALEMDGDVHTQQPPHKMDKLEFTQLFTMVVVSTDGTEHRNPYGIRFRFDETKIDWYNFGGTLSQKQLNIPPMFHVALDQGAGRDSRSVSLKPMYSLGKEEAVQYVQDSVFDGLFYKVSIDSPQATHINNATQVTGRDILLVSGFDCIATHKAEMLELRKQQPPQTGSLNNLVDYLTTKTILDIERVTKVAVKFNQPMERGSGNINRFDLFFKQKGFAPTKLKAVPPQLQLFEKETPTATLYVSPLVAFQVDKHNNYAFAYNLFEESIQDAFKRLDSANQQLLASIVLATDLRTK